MLLEAMTIRVYCAKNYDYKFTFLQFIEDLQSTVFFWHMSWVYICRYGCMSKVSSFNATCRHCQLVFYVVELRCWHHLWTSRWIG